VLVEYVTPWGVDTLCLDVGPYWFAAPMACMWKNVISVPSVHFETVFHSTVWFLSHKLLSQGTHLYLMYPQGAYEMKEMKTCVAVEN